MPYTTRPYVKVLDAQNSPKHAQKSAQENIAQKGLNGSIQICSTGHVSFHPYSSLTSCVLNPKHNNNDSDNDNDNNNSNHNDNHNDNSAEYKFIVRIMCRGAIPAPAARPVVKDSTQRNNSQRSTWSAKSHIETLLWSPLLFPVIIMKYLTR